MSVVLEQFRRVNPYPGLMVDVDVWRDAHDYHRAQLHLHHLALHGWGIVHGLDVSLVDGTQNTLHIGPGLAIDPAGNFVNVPQSQTYQITAREQQQVYIVLQLRELLAEPATPSEANRSSPHTRVLEAYQIQERDRLPEEPYIELARVDFVPGRGAVRAPKNPEAPGQNELDLRSRVRLGTLAAPVAYMPAPVHGPSGDGADALAPRVDSLDEQLRGLGDRIEALAQDVAARPQRAPAVEAEIFDRRELEQLAAQLQQLAKRVDALGAGVAAASHDAPPGAGEPWPDARVSELAERIDALRQQVEQLAAAGTGLERPTPGSDPEVTGPLSDARVSELADRVEALEHRPLPDVGASIAPVAERVDGLAQRVEGLAGEVGALSGRVEASSRDIEALERERGSVQPPATPVPTTERTVLQLALAEHAGGGWDAHRRGLGFLAREITSTTQFDGRSVDPHGPGASNVVDVLYMSGHGALTLSDEEAEGIARVLENGGVVIGEGCAAGPTAENGAREFAMSFVDLATRLGRQLTRVDRGHPIMHARHVFGEPPPGGRATARVLESSGMVYSDADYGCAWQGGPADKAIPRAAIREAFEFGTNLALFRRESTRTPGP